MNRKGLLPEILVRGAPPVGHLSHQAGLDLLLAQNNVGRFHPFKSPITQ